MNKTFTHRNHTFNIKVELNTRIEKRIDGNRWHTVTINCTDRANYYKNDMVLDKDLVGHIKLEEQNARAYVDKKIMDNYINLSDTEKVLISLGFK